MKQLFLATVFSICATGLAAHSPLSATTPADQAVIAEAPSEIAMTFKGTIRLTRVVMTIDDQPGVDLDLSGHSGFTSDYAIPLPAMGPGSYVIDWRGLGSDGHALKGAFRFDVK